MTHERELSTEVSVIASAGTCVIKLVPGFTIDERREAYGPIKDNALTYWLVFSTTTHKLSRELVRGQVFISALLQGEYPDDIVFFLIGSTYRLISKGMTSKLPKGRSVAIDVEEAVNNRDVEEALTIFVANNPEFVVDYLDEGN